MNWYKISAAAPIYDFLATHEVPEDLLEQGVLPNGYYYVEENGRWSVCNPEGQRVSWDEPTKEGARIRAIQLIKFIERQH